MRYLMKSKQHFHNDVRSTFVLMQSPTRTGATATRIARALGPVVVWSGVPNNVFAALAVCSHLSLLSGRMEGLRGAQANAERKVDFLGPEKGYETSNGVVSGSQQVSMREVWKRQQIHEEAKKMHRTQIFVKHFWEIGKPITQEVTIGRKSGWTREILIWCRKCSGFVRQRMGPTLMSCCKPEQVGTKE